MKRRRFVGKLLVSSILLPRMNYIESSKLLLSDFDESEVEFRFLVASDGHYSGKQSDNSFNRLVSAVNNFHKRYPVEFIVINGDIVHRGQLQLFEGAKKALSNLVPNMYVTQGNHDNCTALFWEEFWGIPVNHSFEVKNRGILLGTTSNEFGTSLCPDILWFTEQLDNFKEAKEIYIFLHITPNDWTYYGKRCDEFNELLSNYSNISAVLNGHDHDKDNIMLNGNIPFMFSGRFGSNWGTPYRGFRVVEKLKSGVLRTYMMDPINKRNVQKVSNSVIDVY